MTVTKAWQIAQQEADRYREALENIAALHSHYESRAMEGLCWGCLRAWPCETRALVDEGLAAYS